LEVVTQSSFKILTDEFNHYSKKIYFDDINKKIEYVQSVLGNISSEISNYTFRPLDDKPFMQKWFDVIDINELQPYIATRNLGNGNRMWYKDDFNNEEENCLTTIKK
jgi:hypothetical protein